LIRESKIVKLKKRSPESLNKKRKHTRLTGRDFLQYKVILAEIGGKERKLKNIYVGKERKRIFTTIKKITRKRKSAEVNMEITTVHL
jgi:hypothetical protein